MSRKELTSIFNDLVERIDWTKDFDVLKTEIIEFIEGRKVNPKDTRLMIMNVKGCDTVERLQMYIYNSMLKYQGMGVR